MCRPILSIMIRVIDNQSYDHTPNWIPLGPITIFNYLHGTLNFLGVYVNQTFNLKFYSGGGGGGLIFMLINEFTFLSPIEKMESHAFHYWYFYNLIFNFIRFYYAYGLLFVPRLTILDIGKRWKMVKVLNSMTRRVYIIHNVFGLCILHDTNLVLSGSSRYPFEERTLHVKDRLFAS